MTPNDTRDGGDPAGGSVRAGTTGYILLPVVHLPYMNVECPDCGLRPLEMDGSEYWCDECERHFTEEESDEALYGPGPSGGEGQ